MLSPGFTCGLRFILHVVYGLFCGLGFGVRVEGCIYIYTDIYICTYIYYFVVYGLFCVIYG